MAAGIVSETVYLAARGVVEGAVPNEIELGSADGTRLEGLWALHLRAPRAATFLADELPTEIVPSEDGSCVFIGAAKRGVTTVSRVEVDGTWKRAQVAAIIRAFALQPGAGAILFARSGEQGAIQRVALDFSVA